MAKSIRDSFLKAVGLFMIASSLGGAVVVLERYHDAKASDILPGVSMPRLLSTEPKTARFHLFSMKVSGFQKRYETFEVSVVDQGGEITARLRLKDAAKGAVVRNYERDIDEAGFARFWAALRALEVSQLTDLSPATEKMGEANRTSIQRKTGSETLNVKFQDGLYDYPNSFRVYAPEVLEDGRYLALRNLTGAFVAETFGDVLFE